MRNIFKNGMSYHIHHSVAYIARLLSFNKDGLLQVDMLLNKEAETDINIHKF